MKLATVEKILKLTPIEGADRIVLATILGWEVVVKKDDFNEGDLCVYIPIDTMVDPKRSYFSFLMNLKKPDQLVRINTTKLRGKWSQGLAIPISCLEPSTIYNEGYDVSEELGVVKYEKENSILFLNKILSANAEFPSYYISKTDEDNLRTKYKVINEFINKQIYITQKMDGSSMTLIWNSVNNEFLVCSRNLIVDEASVMYQYTMRENLKNRIIEHGLNLAIQGEFCGPKINGNCLGLTDYKFYVFTIKNLETDKIYGWEEIKKITDKLQIETVPLVDTFVCDDSWDLNKFQELSNSQIYVQSTGKKVPGEGIVIRPYEPVFSYELFKMLSVKVINQNYKD